MIQKFAHKLHINWPTTKIELNIDLTPRILQIYINDTTYMIYVGPNNAANTKTQIFHTNHSQNTNFYNFYKFPIIMRH
jgi:hypothetical protein